MCDWPAGHCAAPLVAGIEKLEKVALASHAPYDASVVVHAPDAAGTRTVDSHVKGLRAKLGGDLIRTVHGVGYALETGPA